nr:MAG TPA: hypothetical protein [Caudoviricetes sp.]
MTFSEIVLTIPSMKFITGIKYIFRLTTIKVAEYHV